jgi:hypothetical protein
LAIKTGAAAARETLPAIVQKTHQVFLWTRGTLAQAEDLSSQFVVASSWWRVAAA